MQYSQRWIRLSLACSLFAACAPAGLPAGTGTNQSAIGSQAGANPQTPNASTPVQSSGAVGGNPQIQPSAEAPKAKPEFAYTGTFPTAIKGQSGANYSGLLKLESVSDRAAANSQIVYKLAAQPWADAAGQSVDGPASLPARWNVKVYQLDSKGQRYGSAVASDTHTGEFSEIRWNGVSAEGRQMTEGRFVVAAVPEGFPAAPVKDPLLLLNTPLPTDAPAPEYATSHLLARFRDPVQAAARYRLLNTDAAGWSKVSVSTTVEPGKEREALLELAQRLVNDPNVDMAEPDITFRVGFRPNDPRLNEQYALQKVKAEEAWDLGMGQAGTVIAIIDTGIDPSHPDLRARLVPGWNAITRSNDTRDDHGHGTHCAGIAAGIANNSEGIAGLAPGSSIMPVKVMGANGSGSSLQIAEGVRWAADHGAHVINLSLGMTMGSEVVLQALQYAVGKGVIILAAMGNDGGQVANYPAAYSSQLSGLMAVGATNSGDQRAYFSNYGHWISVTAPGDQILSTLPPQYLQQMNPSAQLYGNANGTSMATPYVAGLAALLKAQQPSRSPSDIATAIIQGADDLGPTGFDSQYGHGRINAFRSMSLNLPLASPTPTPVPTATPTPGSTPVPTPTPSFNPPVSQPAGGLVLDID